jgi:hypothetical protein
MRVGAIGAVTALLGLGCSTSSGGQGDTSSDLGDPSRDAGESAPDVPRDVFILPEVMTRDVVITPGREFTYVVNAMTIDPSSEPTQPHTGFNIDGQFSDDQDPNGCNKPDLFSAIDPDQNRTGAACTAANCGGVDNQLPRVVEAIEGLRAGAPTNFRAYLQGEIDHSRLAFIVRLTGVDDFMNDDAIGVYVYQGYPTFTTMCDTVVPGREYQITRTSLQPGGRTLDEAAVGGAGQIVNGRLDFQAPGGALPIAAPVATGTFTIQFERVRLRMNLTPTAGTGGNLSGYMRGEEVISAVAHVAPLSRELIEPLVADFVDVRLDGLCAEGARGRMRFGAISLGAGLSTVAATIRAANPITDARTPGACGGM